MDLMQYIPHAALVVAAITLVQLIKRAVDQARKKRGLEKCAKLVWWVTALAVGMVCGVIAQWIDGKLLTPSTVEALILYPAAAALLYTGYKAIGK